MDHTSLGFILGSVLAVLALFSSSCSSSSGSLSGQLYVLDAGPNSASNPGSKILRFSNGTTANGDTLPSATITFSGSSTSCPHFGYLDTTNDRIYLADYCNAKILVINNLSKKSGAVTPDRTITSSPAFCGAMSVAVDVTKDRMYVSNAGCPGTTLGSGSNANSIFIFDSASTLSGSTTPTAIISQTGIVGQNLRAPHGVFIDSNTDRLFVASYLDNSVLIYQSASTLTSSTSTPTLSITSSSFLSQPLFVQLDQSGNLLVSTRGGTTTPPTQNAGSIVVFSSSFSSLTGAQALTPVRTITGGNSALTGPYMMFYASTSDELFVANSFYPSISVFSSIRTATGNVTPSRSLTGPNTGFAIPAAAVTPRTSTGIFIDLTR